MNIKKKIPRLMSVLLSFSMAFGGVIPAYATEAIITENSIEEAEFDAAAVNEIDEEAVADEIEAQADSDSRYETVEVNYSQSSNYFVTIPKTIVLGTDKMSPYSIKVEGDIVANKQVCVVPVDGIEETEVFDFYMSDQIAGSTKADVVAEVSQTKFYWSHEEVAAGYEENDNYIVADGLSAGKWKGIFQLEISMRTDPTHIHNYVGEVKKEPTCTESGEKTYTCDCGDSYVETIDPTGHHFEKGECTICGEKDPDHEHNYTEVVTKQPTCTEDGEKTYTCDCGDSYTEVIPATGHHYVDGECEHCGEKDPDAHTHNYIETITKEPTCTEEGEKTYTCECGDSYTEVMPATSHHYVDGECEYCGEKDPDAHTHNYIETITKEATCTENGEKKYTCECGDSYTEVIPAGHHYGDDDKCIECGEFNPNHTHNYVDNTNLISWENTSNGTYAFIKEGTKWTSNNKGIKSSTATSAWTIIVTEDTEYSFKYKVSSEQGYDKLTIKLDDTTVANAISGIGNEETYTITLTAGTHTLTASYVKDGSSDKNDDCGYVILEDIGEFNHKCTICQNIEDHNYIEEITKEPCMENGEKTYTCNVCGYTYTEEIPAYGKHIDEDGDDVCDKCGHRHIGEENTDVISWIDHSMSSSVVQTGNSWKLHYDTSNQYSTYTVNGYWNITVPQNVEYTFNYGSAFMDTDDRVRIYVDDELIVDFADSSKNGSEKISLAEGEHTIHMCFNKNNTIGTSAYATITLNPVEALNHICNDCGEKKVHIYTERITKEPTCTEKGEKELICTKCVHSHTEEIEATGHDYVDNTVGNYSNHKCAVCGDEKEHSYGDDLVCTVCGHFRGEYTFIFNSESKIGNLSSDTEYELEKVYLSDGDQIILPNASSSDYSLDGWYYAKAVNQPYMYNKGLSHALNGTYDCWANVDVKLQSRGDGVHVTDQNTGKEWYTNYEWQNEATTDIFTISTPSVYEFQITEKQDINTITLDGGWSLQYLLKDITNNKSYDLRDIVPFLDNTVIKYDYGNIKIKCSKVDNAHMNSSKIINGTITYYYTVYFEPGEYQITLSGSIGSSTASPTTSTIDVNMYGSGAKSNLYELRSLNDGETFDASAMYTEEGNKEIYCIPKWKNIE